MMIFVRFGNFVIAQINPSVFTRILVLYCLQLVCLIYCLLLNCISKMKIPATKGWFGKRFVPVLG